MATRIRINVSHVETNGGIDGLRDLLQHRAVKVGVLRGTGPHPNSEEGLSVAQVMAFNEFGTDTIPERSMIRFTLRARRRIYRRVLARLFRKVYEGRITDRAAIAAFGELVQTDIQQRIVGLKTPPNSPETIARKGSSNPLIGTGTMRQSIRWELTNVRVLRNRTSSS